MADIKGQAISWAVQGIALTAGIVPGTGETPAIQRYRAQKDIEGEALIKGSDGKVVTMVVPDIRSTLSMTVIPTADTLAHMRSLMDRFYIAPGTKITTTDSEGNTEGNFVLQSCGQERVVEGAVAVDITGINFTTDISTSAA